jgi:predicted AlkP superfamily phosphohydrolase/phosphomutase
VDALLHVDWPDTRAYGIGLNGLYINVKGRERDGVVPPGERDALLAEIAEKLAAVIDPETGKPVLSRVYLRDETYADGGHREIGPDAVLGYTKGTRGSNPSAKGTVGAESLTDNEDPWSGDHGMDAPDVPGILAASRPLKRPAANLQELRSSVLAEFGIADDGARPGSN